MQALITSGVDAAAGRVGMVLAVEVLAEDSQILPSGWPMPG